MNLSQEWRFLWPASHSSHAPPLISRDNSLGPLLLQPLPATLTPLLSVLPTSSTLPSYAPHFTGNRLEPLPCPDGRSTLVFFSTGDNLDRVGFVLLRLSDSQVRVQGDVFYSPSSICHQILQLAAREASEDDGDDCLGFLVASTMFSVHWFRVLHAARGTDSEKPVLDSIGSKLFMSSPVAHVCWSPHLPEETLVLLQSGHLFLFDVASTASFEGKRLAVSWDGHGDLTKIGGWLRCEFSWHPRILVVANSEAVFLVDVRFDKCCVDCIMKVSLLGATDAVESERFMSFSKAGSGGFYYVAASQCWLVLIDIRVLCKPVLHWMHNLQYPYSNVSVFPLSRLRGDLGNDEYNQASELGYGIVLGSLLTCEFSLFCFGPCLKKQLSVSSKKRIKASGPFYAWDLPSELCLTGRHSPSSSSCLVRQEFPEWIDWQLKKQLVLGFCVLDNVDGAAGFMLVRLMSSGKLESQRYNTC